MYTLNFGASSFTVDARVGARVVEFAVGGQNVLAGPDAHPTLYGSTFWTAPESDWAVDPFQAVYEVDAAPYKTTRGDDGEIVAVGPDVTIAGKHCRVTKRFRMNPAGTAVTLEYAIENRGSSAFALAPWEVTRVPGDGLTFYPAGGAGKVLYGPLSLVEKDTHRWLDHKGFAGGAPSKDIANAGAGWVAHVAGNLLFVKQFTDHPPGSCAPGHEEIELFAAADRSYIEVEIHGPYQEVLPGGALRWQTTWYLCPFNGNTELGSQSLVRAVEELLKAL